MIILNTPQKGHFKIATNIFTMLKDITFADT